MARPRGPVATFAIATLLPLPLLAASAFWGGGWVLFTCLYLTLFTYLLDELIGYASEGAPTGVEFPAADWLSLLLGALHLPVLGLGVAAISGATGLSGIERVGCLLAFGIYAGQVLFSNAHELIHRPGKLPFRLGALVYSSALYGHHVTAHRFIHHRFVGSAQDPNTARFGEGFWTFAIRAWIDAFRAGLKVEAARRRKTRLGALAHPYIRYEAIALTMLALVYILWDLPGVAAYLALALYACIQMLLADYVQHYGLKRQTLPNGRLEPIGPQHSWNAPHPVSAALMLNAPRHSDHHTDASKPFPALELPDESEAPMLPASLPAMSTLALFPPLWRRVMDPRARVWRKAGEETLIAAE